MPKFEMTYIYVNSFKIANNKFIVHNRNNIIQNVKTMLSLSISIIQSSSWLSFLVSHNKYDLFAIQSVNLVMETKLKLQSGKYKTLVKKKSFVKKVVPEIVEVIKLPLGNLTVMGLISL